MGRGLRVLLASLAVVLTPAASAAATPHVAATIPVGGRPVAVAAGFGLVWVVDQAGGTVERIDPRTNTVAVGSVWVANVADSTVTRIEP